MKLSELLLCLPEYRDGQANTTEVLGLSADTREIQPGFVFVAVRGTTRDGHEMIEQARQKGAVFVVGDRAEAKLDLQVENSRVALEKMASLFYGEPSRNLMCFGVTGTNGKTSITYLLEHVLESVGAPTGVLGTIDHHLRDQKWATDMTTPGPVRLQQRLQEMKQAGARAVAMEVSSHALDQHRADGIHFDVSIFTNLTRDHLDYHGDMEKYFHSKERLFRELMATSEKFYKTAVINTDDKWGRLLRLPMSCELISYGQSNADFCFKIQRTDFSGTHFELKTAFQKEMAFIPLCGVHNVYNAVAAIAALLARGISIEKSLQALRTFRGVPGRLQRVPNKKGLEIFVDYAHTPDALENTLQTLKKIRDENQAKNRIITIFGCGGDRDKGKRPLMAQAAEKHSDLVVVTSDNPRTEDPASILHEISDGFSAGTRFFLEVDRRKAFEKVRDLAQAGDVVLIAGKGHEDYQIIGTEKHSFHDATVAEEVYS